MVEVQILPPDDDSAAELAWFLNQTSDLRQAHIEQQRFRPEPGTLGASQSLVQFVGDNVLLPILVASVYDYFKSKVAQKRGPVSVTFVIASDSGSSNTITATITGEPGAASALLASLTE